MARPPVRRAVKAYEDFTGAAPRRVKVARLDDRDVTGWQMGPLVGVAYEAVRDGQRKQYFHEFKKTARPNLVSKDDGTKLYIEGGRYKVTERGVEDMPQLFVVNPSPRSGRSKPKMRRRTTTRRRAPRQVAIFRTNPSRRRRRRTATLAPRRRRFARNPVARVRRRRHSVRRFRRNPSARRIGGAAVSFGRMLLPAAGIGLGAVGSELIMGYLPIPANFKTGAMRHVTKGVIGVSAGLLIGKLLKQKRLGNYLALGSVVIAVHDAAKEMIASRAPAVRLGQYASVPRSAFAGYGGMGYVNPALVGMGEYVPTPITQFAGDATQHGTGGETHANI